MVKDLCDGCVHLHNVSLHLTTLQILIITAPKYSSDNTLWLEIDKN